jgi:hypothetical protein
MLVLLRKLVCKDRALVLMFMKPATGSAADLRVYVLPELCLRVQECDVAPRSRWPMQYSIK